MFRFTWPWRIFMALQAFAICANVSYAYFQSKLGPFLWAIAFILLLPGSLLTSWVIEHTLWHSELRATTVYNIELFAAVAGNAVLWALGIWVTRIVRRRGAI